MLYRHAYVEDAFVQTDKHTISMKIAKGRVMNIFCGVVMDGIDIMKY